MKGIHTLKNIVFRSISFIYSKFFSFRKTQKINHFFLNIILRAMGYNNCCDMKKSGETWFIKNYLRDAELCIDIGANRGKYSNEILKHTESDVIAFEPQNSCSHYLEKVSEEYPGRLKINNLALSSEDGYYDFYYSDDCGGLSTLSKDANNIDYVNRRNKSKSTIETKKLDSFIDDFKTLNKTIDLLKIDVEGYELNILNGAINFLKIFNPKFIQLEFNLHQLFTNNSLYNFGAILKDYNVFRLLEKNRGMIKVDVNNSNSNFYYYSNYIFVNKNF